MLMWIDPQLVCNTLLCLNDSRHQFVFDVKQWMRALLKRVAFFP